MRKAFLVLLALSLVLEMGTSAMATNGYQLIGVGQLQKSMGGAVTAAPRDAMTAITNPAGMSRVGSRADFSMEAFMPTRSVDFGGFGGGKTEGGSDMYGVPAIGWTAPTAKDGWFFGGGMYGTSGLGVDYDEVTMMPGAALDAGVNCVDSVGVVTPCVDLTFNGFSAIQFWKMAPTVAVNVNDKLSIGAAINLDYQSVAISQTFRNIPWATANPAEFYQGDISFDLGRPTAQFGYGFTLGGLYDINDMVTVGAMYSSKQSFSEAEFRVGSGDIAGYGGAQGLPGTYTMDLEYPSQYALGVAVKPIEGLLVALDYKVINWSDTHDKIDFTGPAGAFDLNGPNPGGVTNNIQLNFGWDDQTVIALGVVYAATEDLDISAGFNQADSPIEANDVFNNLVFPATVETHYTLGADYKLGTHWGIGLTYMKAKSNQLVGANDIPADMVAATAFQSTSSGIKIELEEESYGTQLSYRF